MQARKHISKLASAAGGLLCMIVACHAAFGQAPETPTLPSLVEVYWNSSRTIVAPGLTNVMVFDQEIARAEPGADTIQFYGLARGETIALGSMNGKTVSLRVRVIERPPVAVSPSLLRRQSEMVQGSFGTAAQVSNAGGTTSTAFVNDFSWSQPLAGDSRFDFRSQAEDTTFAGGHAFNIRQGALAYHAPGMDVHAMDFNVDLTGNGTQHYLSPYSFSDSLQLRGAGVTLRRGDNQYDFFAGTTIPFYYLTLGSTRDLAGFSFQRKQTEKLAWFANTSFLNAPVGFLGVSAPRRNNIMQTTGFTWLLNKKWSTHAVGGVSNHGGLARGELTYSSRRTTVFASGTVSAPLFPLNQVESLFSGTSSIKAGWTFRHSDSLSESFTYQHTVTQPIAGVLTAGSSDYLSPGVWVRLVKNEELNFNYAYSRNAGGFSADPSTGNRVDASLHSQLTPLVSNIAQITVGSLQDPLGLSSEDQLSLRDGLTFPIKGGSMLVAVERDRSNPSLVQKLNSELGLLTPALQSLFLKDPVSFVDSSNLPPEIKALLAAQQPVGASFSATGQFRLANKLTLNPNFSVARFATGNTQSWTPFAGYGLVYQVRPTLQFNSSMNNVWVLANSQSMVQRTTLFSFGLIKNFAAMPASLMPGHHTRTIEGRVFRDNNLNGVFNAGEPGFQDIQVQLEDGEMATTDEMGRFKFSGVGAGEHQVSVNLTQFRGPVRMTTRNQFSVDLIQQRAAIVNFGIVNFARLMGNVFNDLHLNATNSNTPRPPDAKGMAAIHLILDDGRQKRTIVTRGTGDYEADDVPPGDYKLTIDTSTLPANYAVPVETFAMHVSPVSTAVRDVPVRALRSISGRVFMKAPQKPEIPAHDHAADGRGKLNQRDKASGPDDKPEDNLVPLAGVQITAGYGIARTDENGNFLLRDLPAGDLTVTVVPLRPMPEGMKAPSGAIHLPPEPIQVEGATIVIGNPEMAPYLTEIRPR